MTLLSLTSTRRITQQPIEHFQRSGYFEQTT
jgi:hypothetical protein